MKTKHIDKTTYRKHLNVVIISFVVCLAVLSILFGTVLIHFFADTMPITMPDADNNSPSNFKFNLLGVIIALIFCSVIMQRVKNHEYCSEVYYVWQLKQLHNKIYRRLVKIKKSAFNHEKLDSNALIILAYYYQTLEQVYQLDNNTLTLSSLAKQQRILNEFIAQHQCEISAQQFDENLLLAYN